MRQGIDKGDFPDFGDFGLSPSNFSASLQPQTPQPKRDRYYLTGTTGTERELGESEINL